MIHKKKYLVFALLLLFFIALTPDKDFIKELINSQIGYYNPITPMHDDNTSINIHTNDSN